jgi:Caspase recruitment domain
VFTTILNVNLFLETWSCDDREAQPLDATNRKIIRQKWTALTKFLDLDSGVVNKLFAKGYLSERQREIILGQQVKTQKIEKFLEILLRKSLAAFDAFVWCLEETQQGNVRRLLDGTTGNSILTFYDGMISYNLRCAFRKFTICILLVLENLITKHNCLTST